MKKFNIAIDGPSGAGKSTVAKELAKALKIVYVDTGAMYRALGLYAKQNNMNPLDENIDVLVADAQVTLKYIDKTQHVYLNQKDVSEIIRTEEIGKYASSISINPKIRERMVKMQQQLAEETNVVMDGRDICQVVLPNAEYKFFVTATPEERGKRRYMELKQKGIESPLEEVIAEIKDRDFRDMTRTASPLIQAKDAKLIDTSFMNIQEVVDFLLNIVQDDLSMKGE